MLSIRRLKGSLLTGALALAIGAQAHAALTVNDSFEGAWFNPAESGRGALVDYIATTPGNGVLFITIFSFDTAGNPLWLTTQTPVVEGEFSWSDMDVLRFTGGNFGTPFSTPASAVLGKANVSFASCNAMSINFTPAAGTTLPAVNYSFSRPGTVPSTCVYTEPFSACPAGTTAVAGVDRVCKITSPVTGDVRLSNAATYLIDGPTLVGTGRNTGPGRLIVEPGTYISGSGATLSYLAVQPGSQLIARGKPYAPIVFTGPTPVNGSWAGLVLAGNSQCNSSQDGTPCTFEAVASQQFGGTNTGDSSGVLEYVQVRHAGQEVRPNEELNSITMLGVGSGTVVNHVQIYGGKDDGIEFFGGTVNLRYVVIQGAEDDALDFDLGYQGNIQYAYVRQVPEIGVVGSDSNGIESDNHPSSFDLLPRTRPTISNFTLIGGAAGNEGIRLRRGSGANYAKGLVVGFNAEGLNFNDSVTFGLGGTPTALGTQLQMRDMFLSNNTNFEDNAADPYLISAWYAAGTNNLTGASPLAGTTAFPSSAAAVRLAAPTKPGEFFDANDFIGAFQSADDNWAAGWTFDLR
ncbi:MAG: hypothetical protein R3F18_06925 [Lysobacterales bacterium]|nr:hypothetical protein [Xanthomonadales bacterium]MCB1613773.1 hypothetical protein [Xanthomonadales bacterium]MCP5476847.1 hypothetical protein [Rhodanobacteraceae bacterium]